MRVFLTGFMASGKSTVGRELATLLGARFVDLDEAIEAELGATVGEIFAREGEEVFRRHETRALAALTTVADDALVVATGGGTVCREANRCLMVAQGLIVWLDPGFEVLSGRLAEAAAGERPLFRDREQARRLYERRLAAYRRADLHLEITADEDPREVASRILDELGGKRCAT